MHIEYNGVQLELVTIDRVDRTSIWTPDQTELLYTEWSLLVSCVYHPPVATATSDMSRLGGTSVRASGFVGTLENPNSFVGPLENREAVVRQVKPWDTSPSAANDENVRLTRQLETMASRGKTIGGTLFTPGFGGGEYAPVTDKHLHTLLSIPRRKLKITMGNPNSVGSVTWLESPRPGYTTDARNGPIVNALPVTAINGDGVSFGVQMNIVTWLPPCPQGSDRPILAHRWQMTHERDPDDYLTRHVTGEIHLNGAVLSRQGNQVRADFLIQQMFHPIPLGFRRYIGPVKRSPDGLVLSYAYADVDPSITFDPGNSEATQISVIENVIYTNHSGRLRKIFMDNKAAEG